MAEKFCFHQSLWNGGTIDGHECAVLAGALVVDRFGDKIFAGAALALNQNRGGFAGRDFLHKTHQLEGFRRDGDDFMISGIAPDFASQRLDFGSQAGCLQRILDGDV